MVTYTPVTDASPIGSYATEALGEYHDLTGASTTAPWWCWAPYSYEPGETRVICNPFQSPQLYIYDTADLATPPQLLCTLDESLFSKSSWYSVTHNGLNYCARQDAWYCTSARKVYRVHKNGTYDSVQFATGVNPSYMHTAVGSELDDYKYYVTIGGTYTRCQERAWSGGSSRGQLPNGGFTDNCFFLKIDPVNPGWLFLSKGNSTGEIFKVDLVNWVYTDNLLAGSNSPMRNHGCVLYDGILFGISGSTGTARVLTDMHDFASARLYTPATQWTWTSPHSTTGGYTFRLNQATRSMEVYGETELLTLTYLNYVPAFVSVEADSPFSVTVTWHVRDEHPGPYTVLLDGQVVATGVAGLQQALGGLRHSTEYAVTVTDENTGEVGAATVTTLVISDTGVSITPRWLEPTYAPDVSLVLGSAPRTGLRLQAGVVHASALSVSGAETWESDAGKAVARSKVAIASSAGAAALTVGGAMSAVALYALHDAALMDSVQHLPPVVPSGLGGDVTPARAAEWVPAAAASNAGAVDYPGLAVGAISALKQLDARLVALGL